MEEESFMDMLSSGEEESYLFSLSSSCYPSSTAAQMVCFGGEEEEVAAALHGVPQKPIDPSLSPLSSSPPSPTTSNSKSSNKKKVGSSCSGSGRRRREASIGPGTNMVRKEKLGERIMALQQLVSPFGKSDAASVLHEALRYIRFLHDQVQVLSSPYLQGLPSSAHLHDGRGSNDLSSRGLCLVPVACTEHVARSNGADLWTPGMGNSKSPSSTKH